MALDCLLLDFGGTLAREHRSRAAIYAAEARRVGASVGEEPMRALMERAHDELPVEVEGHWRYSDGWFQAYIRRIFHEGLGVEEAALPGIERALFRTFSDAATFRLFPGAVELLELARARGLRVGLVSNWSPRLADLLGGLGLAARLDFVACSAVERVEKPDARLFQIALERAGAPPERALHAGDHPVKDCGGARSAGIDCVLVEHGAAGAASGAGAPRVGSLAELAQLVEGRLA